MNKERTVSESLAATCGRIADRYDKTKETHRWNGPNVIFGLCFDYIEAGQSILDIGIGTGLGSQLFYKAGLHVYGMDMSPEMLTVCSKKGITRDLKIHDLNKTPYPYANSSFNHAICVGVLNHFDNIEPVFSETSRILKNKGILGFIVADRKSDDPALFEVHHAGSCHNIYRHSSEQIYKYTGNAGFQILHELKFWNTEHQENNNANTLKAYVAGKMVL